MNQTKEMRYSSLNHEVIPFVLFPQASEPSMNFNILKVVYKYWVLPGVGRYCLPRNIYHNIYLGHDIWHEDGILRISWMLWRAHFITLSPKVRKLFDMLQTNTSNRYSMVQSQQKECIFAQTCQKWNLLFWGICPSLSFFINLPIHIHLERNLQYIFEKCVIIVT